MAGVFDLDLNPDRRTLRHFGFFALGGFGLLALLAWFETGIFVFDDWDQSSHELRIASNGGKAVDYIVGAYYNDQTNDYVQSFMFCRGPLGLCESFTAASSKSRSTGPRPRASRVRRNAPGVDPVEAMPALMKSNFVLGKRWRR